MTKSAEKGGRSRFRNTSIPSFVQDSWCLPMVRIWIVIKWRKDGDSNPGDPAKSLHTFQACQFNHSCILPHGVNYTTFPLVFTVATGALIAHNKEVMDNTTTRIQLRGVTKSFGIGDAEHFALDGIDLTVKKGEFIVIMGPSGCGKTTLLNIIGLLDRPTDGEYYLDEMMVDNLSSRRHARIRSEQIGFVFQNFNLIPRLTVIENVALPLTYKGVHKTRRLQEASRILKTFHLGEREYYLPHQLSGGQTQRVAIARALVNKPSIILADEPTGNLDSKTSHIIMEELADIHRRGNTIVMVTHNPDMSSYASRVITMLDGKIDTDSTKASAGVFRKKLEAQDEVAEKHSNSVSSPQKERPKKKREAKKRAKSRTKA